VTRRPPEQLLPLVYEELRRLAAAKMAREAPGQTLQPTALVHEAWLRLSGDAQPPWANRAHFFAAAAEGMRRILIDNARRKRAVRHGGELAKVSADATGFDIASPAADDEELLLVNEALDALAAHDPRKAGARKAEIFRRPHARGGGRRAGHFPPHGQTRLGLRPRLAVQRGATAAQLSHGHRSIADRGRAHLFLDPGPAAPDGNGGTGSPGAAFRRCIGGAPITIFSFRWPPAREDFALRSATKSYSFP
jgi:RNA polymerase sigma factor (TIGR02999 family)